MMTRKLLSYVQLLTLLLLTGYSVAGKSVSTTSDFKPHTSERFNTSESDFHRNMLQTQVVHITALPDTGGKLLVSGFGMLPFSTPGLVAAVPFTPTTNFLQDVDRCESVSRLLFPYHFFW